MKNWAKIRKINQIRKARAEKPPVQAAASHADAATLWFYEPSKAGPGPFRRIA